MRLNILKWIYDLGVRQERVRIASQLELQLAARAFRDNNHYPVIPTDKTEAERKRQDKVMLETAVSHEVSAVIRGVLEPQQFTTGPSIMFPDRKAE